MKKNLKNEKTVTMHNHLKFEEFIDPYAITEIVSSKTYKNGQWRSLTQLSDFKNGISKVVFPVDISKFKIMVLSEVISHRLIKAHKHDDEPMFRYLISGSFKLNGETYTAGDWIIVPVGYSYEIYTETGYVTMTPYGQACTCTGDH